MSLSSSRLVRSLALLAIVASVIAVIALFSRSNVQRTAAADITVTKQQAAQGKPITPAGELLKDATTRQPAIGALTVGFVPSPDRTGSDGRGRYIVAVNSGFGIQFNSVTNRAQQSLAVIDLDAKPTPAVIQNVYFPSPQSVNVGVAFSPQAEPDGTYMLYASGGFENKIWMFRFQPGARAPIAPTSPGPNTIVEAPFIDISAFANRAPSSRYNMNRAPVYPTGLATDGDSIFVANNLDDSLGIISDLRGKRHMTRVELRRPEQVEAGSEAGVYPYGVVALPTASSSTRTLDASLSSTTSKVYVSLWNDASIAVVDLSTPRRPRLASRIVVARHPTAMAFNSSFTRLYVINSNADSVSVIDTRTDREIERINVRLAEEQLLGASPEGLALSDDGSTLYVANAHSNSIAVINLSPQASAMDTDPGSKEKSDERSIVRGFIPTGQYPSAVSVERGHLFVGNGKGTGFENSSLVANNSGGAPNVPNDRFPAGTGRGSGQGGEYSVALIAGNISRIPLPQEPALARYTQAVMRNNNLLGRQMKRLFSGASPIKHIIYIIKENRTYDQVFGDIERSGDGTLADGDASLAIFGAGDAAQAVTSRAGTRQNVTPNHRALALRFGLFDRFFVNSEASPDGHNWSTAAFSTDYTDKAYRWNYSGRGRTYDFEGFNRLPSFQPSTQSPPFFHTPVDPDRVADNLRRYIPYLNGARDVAEPDTLYLWDAAARAKLTYRNYGEFVATFSEADLKAINTNKDKPYPDLSPTSRAVPTKKTLEGHHSATFRNYDLDTPDVMTTDSYRVAKEAAKMGTAIDPTISRTNPETRHQGNSRFGEWFAEFETYVANRTAGSGAQLPNFSMLRFSNDHTAGLRAGAPTPQFYMADNDYAVGKLVEAVSNSPYWKDTAIFIVEDDAQDGPDHVDAHRSVALVISAYNRPGKLIHEFHNTVSLIRTMELLLGMSPMNALDAVAVPMDIFHSRADLTPYKATLPEIALDNLITPASRDAATARFMRRTAEQNMNHADMADARALNEIIWFSVRGAQFPMPEVARLPAFDAMREGIASDDDEEQAEVED